MPKVYIVIELLNPFGELFMEPDMKDAKKSWRKAAASILKWGIAALPTVAALYFGVPKSVVIPIAGSSILANLADYCYIYKREAKDLSLLKRIGVSVGAGVFAFATFIAWGIGTHYDRAEETAQDVALKALESPNLRYGKPITVDRGSTTYTIVANELAGTGKQVPGQKNQTKPGDLLVTTSWVMSEFFKGNPENHTITIVVHPKGNFPRAEKFAPSR